MYFPVERWGIFQQSPCYQLARPADDLSPLRGDGGCRKKVAGGKDLLEGRLLYVSEILWFFLKIYVDFSPTKMADPKLTINFLRMILNFMIWNGAEELSFRKNDTFRGFGVVVQNTCCFSFHFEGHRFQNKSGYICIYIYIHLYLHIIHTWTFFAHTHITLYLSPSTYVPNFQTHNQE